MRCADDVDERQQLNARDERAHRERKRDKRPGLRLGRCSTKKYRAQPSDKEQSEPDVLGMTDEDL